MNSLYRQKSTCWFRFRFLCVFYVHFCVAASLVVSYQCNRFCVAKIVSETTCVEWDVKLYSFNQSINQSVSPLIRQKLSPPRL